MVGWMLPSHALVALPVGGRSRRRRNWTMWPPMRRRSPRAVGGAYLRQEGLYSSQITEWRRLRDAGVLAGKSAGAKIGRPTAEQAEIARLRRQLDLAQRRLSRTEAALSIMGKTHALLEEISKSAPDQPAPKKR